MNSPAKVIKCAIYCRKSSEEGLGQQFNSLDAQRQSGEAYVASQKGEGLVCLPDHYDDGGVSGGTLERPALQRLLADIQAGKVNAVVCYKLDRLTRSIRHFGQVMELFERHGVALMVVSQPIQTSTSIGRLMVNVLMSFAEFERELASDRTRDKIALSRQRGQWTGGRPILGYDIVNTTLVLNSGEAKAVRAIYDLYLELRSFTRVLEALAKRGILNKSWTSKAGRAMGGKSFCKSRLSQLLSNPLYIGRVPHGDKTYPGQHPAIIDQRVFDRVQLLLSENGRSGASLTRNRHGGLLKSLIRCACCQAPMIHTTTTPRKGCVTHRYYRCLGPQAQGRAKCEGASVPAEQIEKFVIDKVRSSFVDPALVTLVLDVARARGEEQVRDLEVRRVLADAELAEIECAQKRGERDPETALRREEVEAHLGHLGREIEDLKQSLVTRGAVEHGLKAFEPIWSSFSPTEKARLLALVVGRVDFDGLRGEITIALREDAPAGVQPVAVGSGSVS